VALEQLYYITVQGYITQVSGIQDVESVACVLAVLLDASAYTRA
jgi:hypothetical protein